MENTLEAAHFHAMFVCARSLLTLIVATTVLIISGCEQSVASKPRDAAVEADVTSPTATPSSNPSPQRGIAVVELFTSEGCSSCPPADTLLGEIDLAAQHNQTPVYCLSFHVDTWNRLGWIDRLSDARYTRREEAYARMAEDGQLYTPMMRVNGGRSFVGSDRQTATREIDAAMAKSTLVRITGAATEASDGVGIHVSYVVGGAPSGSVLNIALIQNGIRHKILHGENGGRTLEHDRVVRAFATVDINKSTGEVDLTKPDRDRGNDLQVVLYAQATKTMQIIGAIEIALAPPRYVPATGVAP